MFSIIIVDDNKQDREGVRDMIDWDSLGIKVAGLASEGREGLHMALELKPEFILTDVSMPVMGGIEMTQSIQKALPDTKFIFMSCFIDFDFLKNAINLDVCGYILKPIDLSELTDAIIKVKRLKQLELDKNKKEHMLKMRLQESLPILQEHFFFDLFYGKIQDGAKIKERMQYLNLAFNSCAVVFLQIDNYNEAYTHITAEERHLLIYDLHKKVSEMVLSVIPGHAVIQQNSSITITLCPDENDKSEAMNKIIEVLYRLKDAANENGISVTMGISEIFSEPEEILPAYKAAAYAVETKFYSSANKIILTSDVIEPDSDRSYDVKEVAQAIKFIIDEGKREDTEAFMRDYFNPEFCYQVNYAKSLAFTIVNTIQILLIERNESFSNIICDDMLLWGKIVHFETLIDVKQWLYNIIETVRQFFKNNGRYQKIAEDIKALIREKYAEIENIDQITKPLYISTSHANFVFKQQTGQTIFDYLVTQRMEAAKEKLMNPYVKIYEVAGEVGYKTNSYFTSAFKEYFGVTPKQFREKRN